MLCTEVRGEAWKCMARTGTEVLMRAEGGGMGTCGTSGAGGIIFGGNFVSCSRQVHEEVILEVSGRTSKVSVVGLC